MYLHLVSDHTPVWQDPLEPFVQYWHRYVMHGFGLFTEGYVLFSISNVKTLFDQSYQSCWKK